MKRAVILHGTEATPQDNWFPWLKAELEKQDYTVWVPQLPNAATPNAARYTEFLLQAGWDFDGNLLIGHSAGAVEILHLLQHLPPAQTVKTAVLAGAFTEAITEDPEWYRKLHELFLEPYDYARIKSRADHFLFVHGSDDPYCDPKNAQWLAGQVGGDYVEIPNGQHFSVSLGAEYKEFPQLLTLLTTHKLL